MARAPILPYITKTIREMLAGHRFDLLERAERLRTAIFTNASTAVIKLPPCLIQVLATEQPRHIWFTVSRPYQDLSGCDHQFYSMLRFYNKMYDYYIFLEGNATIVEEDTAYCTMVQKKKGQALLIRFTISTAYDSGRDVSKPLVLSSTMNQHAV